MSKIETTTDKDTNHPIVSLTEGRSEGWYQAFDDYVKWPHGGGAPEASGSSLLGPPKGLRFSAPAL